jgi:membrane fusion protein (multidrug efflux system)
MKKYIFVIIPFIIVVLAVLSVLSGRFWVVPPAPRLPQNVVVFKISRLIPSASYEVIGILEADKKVELKARVSGFLNKKDFNEGDLVEASRVLFQIEPEQYEAALEAALADELSAKAQLTKSELDFDRISGLYAKRTAPKSDYDTSKANLDVAQATLKSAQARLAQAQLNLGYAFIKAPFTGQVSDTPYSEGSLLGPESGVLATVVSLDPVLVTFGISDKFMSELRRGSSTGVIPASKIEDLAVRLKLNGDVFYDLPGEISYVAPLVDRQTDTIKLKARFKNPLGVLAPGQIVVVSLEPSKPESLLIVPKAAVVTTFEGTQVYVPEKMPPSEPEGQEVVVASTKIIKIGQEYKEGYVVLEGLEEGEEVLIQGLMVGGARLRPGTPIAIVR